MVGGGFLLCVPPGENLPEKSFVTFLTPNTARISGVALTVRYLILTCAIFGYFYPHLRHMLLPKRRRSGELEGGKLDIGTIS